MSLVKKSFSMSMFASSADLYKAKASYYEEQAEALQMELAVSQEQNAHLERVLFTTSQQADRLQLQLDEKDSDLS